MKKKMDTVPEETRDCPIYKVMEIFQGKWNTWILFELGRNGTMRFGELRKAIPGISNTVLTSSLRDLEGRGLVERIQYNEIPPHVEYAATDSAKELSEVFQAMRRWGEKHLDRISGGESSSGMEPDA